MIDLLGRLGKSTAVIGMAKNTGKTVTINYLIDSALGMGRRVGLTSTGLDGEVFDSVTSLPKPPIILPEGAWLATSRGSLSQGSARLEVVQATGIFNPLGEVLLARVRRGGTVEVSGPERTEDLKAIIQMLKDRTDLVLVDGALDRRAASAPGITETCVLATGAVISATVEGLVKATAHQAGLISLDPWPGPLQPLESIMSQGGLANLSPQGAIESIPLLTAVDGPQELLDYLKPGWSFVVGGAFTEELAARLTGYNWPQGLDIIVPDGSKVFVGPETWHGFRRRGGRVWVFQGINLAAITVNPRSPRGRQVSGEEVVAKLRDLYPHLTIFDPLATGGN